MKLKSLLACLFVIAIAARGQMLPHTLHANGKDITLSLPAAYDIRVAIDGLRRVRFFAKSPDGRIFVTDMFSRADNSRGRVLILDGWDAASGRFARTVPYLAQLRNPNSIAFYTDPAGQAWLYVALTDKLERFRYKAGDMQPSGEPQVLARYPDYGLDYKYGGWHLTRTVAFGTVRGSVRLFVSVGSSCNACAETEAIRATISVMNVDGTHSTTLARNVRNAVGLRWDEPSSSLLATNMGDDQLGDRAPEDTVLRFTADEITAVESGAPALDAGWPACYAEGAVLDPDPALGQGVGSCRDKKAPLTTFAAHSSPLGIEKANDQTFLVALHGAGHPRIGSGYRVVQFTVADPKPRDFITGFLAHTQAGNKVVGRPCGLLRLDDDHMLLTDDLLGAIYSISRTRKQ